MNVELGQCKVQQGNFLVLEHWTAISLKNLSNNKLVNELKA